MIGGLGGFPTLTLPAGERQLWQGRPGALALAIRVFHVRLVAAYFGLLFAGRVVASLLDHHGLKDALAGGVALAIPAAIVFALLAALALLYSRTTRYTITDRRVLLQFGVALPMTLNVPFSRVTGAGLKVLSDRSGDIPLAVTSEKPLAYPLLWPHARPWRLTTVEPMLRCVPDAQSVAKVLSGALAGRPYAETSREVGDAAPLGGPAIASAA